jgi:hypothetical protein
MRGFFINMKKRDSRLCGVSLVELLITMLISSIAISGMTLAYIDGLKYWRRSSEKMILFTEGSAALKTIEIAVSQATHLYFHTNWKVPSNQMNVTVTTNGDDSKYYEFYYQAFDNTIRYNDLTGYIGKYNIRLLPMYKYRYRQGERPYLNIESITFTPFDPLTPLNPTTDGYTTVKIELMLTDPQADTLILTSVVSKGNYL